MVTATETDLHLIELRAENFKRFTAFLLRPDGNHAIIRGKNTAGKTSCCEALDTLIRGADSRKIPDPIRHGETKATLVADLGDITIKRTITDKGQTLEVRGADGSKIARPQQLLDSLRGTNFDVVGFMNARPQDQVDAVLSVCKVLPPIEAVREATGEHHPAKDGESADNYLARLSADETGKYFVDRRAAGRVVEQKKKALTEQEAVVKQLGGPPNPLDDDDLSPSAILDRITALQAEDDIRVSAEREAREAKAEYEAKAAKLRILEADVKHQEQDIAELQRRIETARATLATTLAKLATGQEVVAEIKADAEKLAIEAARHTDHRPTIVELRKQVSEADRKRDSLTKRQHAFEQQQRLAREVDLATGEHQVLDQKLSRLRYLRAHLLDDVQLGIPGLEVGQGELRLNNLSLRSASTAELLTVAVAVATRQESRLKLLWVDQGERLDTEHREVLLQKASEAGWRVILTVVSDDDEPVIEIVDGDAA